MRFIVLSFTSVIFIFKGKVKKSYTLKVGNPHPPFPIPSPTPYSVYKITGSLPPTKNFVTKFTFIHYKYKALGFHQGPCCIY